VDDQPRPKYHGQSATIYAMDGLAHATAEAHRATTLLREAEAALAAATRRVAEAKTALAESEAALLDWRGRSM
jgi:hypothetical protein